MKGNDPNLFGALLSSLLVHLLLRGQTLFWTRAGLLTLLPGIFVTTAAGLAFCHAWPLARGRVASTVFCCVLAVGAALEILNLWRLYTAVYPDAVSLLGICLTVLIPVVYLRRVSAVAQTANVVLALLLAAGLLLVVSIAPRLRVTNLQVAILTPQTLWQAARAQCVLYPELLLPALWPDRGKRGRHTVFRLAVFSGLFGVGVHLVLELFFGAAMPQASQPMHQAARCGNLSVFDRLEWLQLIVWTMAVAVKLGLYLYAFTRLTGGEGANSDNLRGLPKFLACSAGLVVLCAVADSLFQDAAQLSGWYAAAVWAFAILTAAMGGVKWLWQKRAGAQR